MHYISNENILQTESNCMSYKKGSICSNHYLMKGILEIYLQAKAELAFVRSDFYLGLQKNVGILPVL